MNLIIKYVIYYQFTLYFNSHNLFGLKCKCILIKTLLFIQKCTPKRVHSMVKIIDYSGLTSSKNHSLTSPDKCGANFSSQVLW